MDTESIKQLATDVNNVALASFQSGKEHIERPLMAKIERLQTKLWEVQSAAAKWPRCCDCWQDGFGTFACRECQQKTFSMLYNVQKILGIDKSGKLKGETEND